MKARHRRARGHFGRWVIDHHLWVQLGCAVASMTAYGIDVARAGWWS